MRSSHTRFDEGCSPCTPSALMLENRGSPTEIERPPNSASPVRFTSSSSPRPRPTSQARTTTAGSQLASHATATPLPSLPTAAQADEPRPGRSYQIDPARSRLQSNPKVEPIDLEIVLWNCEGAATALSVLPPSTFTGSDLIVLVETWSTTPISIEGFYAAHYPASRTNRFGRPSGGISLYYNQKLEKPQIVFSEDNCIVMRTKYLDVVAMYIRPDPAETTLDLVEKLEQCIGKVFRAKKTLLLGDFNAKMNRPEETRTIAFLETLRNFGLHVINDPNFLTFNGPMGSSAIDVFATNLPRKRIEFQGTSQRLAEDDLLSPHSPIAILIRDYESEQANSPKIPPSRRLNINRMISLVSRLGPPDRWASAADVDTLEDSLSSVLRNSTEPRAPRVERPWWNRNCTNIKRMMLRARTRALTHPFMRPLFVRLKSVYRRTLKDAKREHWNNLEARMVDRATKLPHIWLRLSNQPRTTCPVERDVLVKHFEYTLSSTDSIPSSTPSYQAVWSESDTQWRDQLCLPFTAREIYETIECLADNKACGPDEIYNEHLKTSICIVPYLEKLFNRCFEDGSLPRTWSRGIMVIIPKSKGPLTDPKSWRGITKKSCILKLLSKMILNRIVPFLDMRGIIPEQQHGFRVGESTFSACRELMNDIRQALDRTPHHLHAVFIDFTSAFDSGSRSLTLESRCPSKTARPHPSPPTKEHNQHRRRSHYFGRPRTNQRFRPRREHKLNFVLCPHRRTAPNCHREAPDRENYPIRRRYRTLLRKHVSSSERHLHTLKTREGNRTQHKHEQDSSYEVQTRRPPGERRPTHAEPQRNQIREQIHISGNRPVTNRQMLLQSH